MVIEGISGRLDQRWRSTEGDIPSCYSAHPLAPAWLRVEREQQCMEWIEEGAGE